MRNFFVRLIPENWILAEPGVSAVGFCYAKFSLVKEKNLPQRGTFLFDHKGYIFKLMSTCRKIFSINFIV